jgi:hypothetical protein|tara:strand:- start:1803 stop:2015 length:213 start_codon:yes stop_codon:yes gene_type:complete
MDDVKNDDSKDTVGGLIYLKICKYPTALSEPIPSLATEYNEGIPPIPERIFQCVGNDRLMVNNLEIISPL